MKDLKKVKNIIFLFFLSFQSLSYATVETTLGPVQIKNNPNLSIGIPTSENPEIIISRNQYIISYNKVRRNPNWVTWKLDTDEFGTAARTVGFTGDEELVKYLAHASGEKFVAVQPTEYVGTCFDRGHQIPSADRTKNEENNKATFVMSNIVPQTPYLNRFIWEHLEQHTRILVKTQNKKAYIFAGPIYDEDFGAIGPKHDIQVPSKEFKIIFLLDSNQTAAEINANTESIAVIMPNTLEDGSKPQLVAPCSLGANAQAVSTSSMNDWEKYKTSVDQIEKLSGIHFFTH